MTTTVRHLVSAVAVAVAAAIALAPAANAGPNAANCRQSGGSTSCQKDGHFSMHTKPQVRTPNGGLTGSAWLPGYGRGILPPLLALD